MTVKAQDGPSKIVFNIDSMASMSRYKIKVEQIKCTDTDMLAPPGCLTYDTGLSGTLTSYNYDAGQGEMINNQKFSHCIMYQDGYCDVSFTSGSFDIGANNDAADSITIGSSVQTGNTFGTSGMVNCKSLRNLRHNSFSFIQIISSEFHRPLRVPRVHGRPQHRNEHGIPDLIPPPPLLKPEHLRSH